MIVGQTQTKHTEVMSVEVDAFPGFNDGPEVPRSRAPWIHPGPAPRPPPRAIVIENDGDVNMTRSLREMTNLKNNNKISDAFSSESEEKEGEEIKLNRPRQEARRRPSALLEEEQNRNQDASIVRTTTSNSVDHHENSDEEFNHLMFKELENDDSKFKWLFEPYATDAWHLARYVFPHGDTHELLEFIDKGKYFQRSEVGRFERLSYDLNAWHRRQQVIINFSKVSVRRNTKRTKRATFAPPTKKNKKTKKTDEN